jgi:hypothetical protein
MIRKLAVILAAAALAPVAAFAEDSPPSPQQSAQQRCDALRTQLGAAAFSSTYGKNASDANAFGKCVSSLASSSAQAQQNAAKQCRTEQADAAFASAHGGKTFDQFYGGEKGKGALGKCVSSKATQAEQDQDEDTTSAARLCKAQRTQLGPQAFTLLYGGQANAFGKCVSKLAQEHAQNETESQSAAEVNAADQQAQQATLKAAKACKAEFAADSKAFVAKYGKNSSKANAFGKCVSSKAKTQ